MIDFRYHLVSLVSVFLALAVGIVLGAGPLKDSIGTTLTEQVQSLRDEKDGLRVQLGTATAAVQHRDDFVTAVTPSLVSGQLANSSVALLTLPDVDSDVVDPLVDAITTAGGKVTGRVSLNGDWIDPAKADARSKVITDLAAALPAGTVPTTGEVDIRLANLLAGALVTTGADPVGQNTETGSKVLDALRAANLIEIKGNVSGLAGGAMVLAPANTVDSAAVKATPVEDTLDSYVSLATALDTVGGGAVVTGPASSATDGGVLAAIRKDDTAKSRVSTVDSGSSPMGVITAVLAMREQLSGGSGAYGFGSGVGDLLPALVGAAPGVTSSPSAPK
jgi:copper transport outer membrane protein MctB